MNIKKCCSAEEDNAMLQGSNLPRPHLLAALQHHHIAQELTGGCSTSSKSTTPRNVPTRRWHNSSRRSKLS